MEDRLFDFEDIWHLFKKKFWIIIVITAITTSLGVYKVSKLQPSYVATAKVFIGKSDDLLEIYTQQEMESYSQFLTTFTEISRIDGFYDEVLKKNNINKTSTEVASAINFSSSANVPIINLSYSSWTDEQMAEALDAVCEEFLSKVKEKIPNAVPSILNNAKVSTIYPNKTKLPIMTFAVGIVLSIGLILVLDYLDTRVTCKKELEKIIPVPVLGTIPMHEKEFKREIKKYVRSKGNAQITVSRVL